MRWIAVLLILAAPLLAENVRVRMETQLGVIEIDVDAAHAPVTAANFLKYADGGFYDGGAFHRTVKPDNQPASKMRIQVVQAGINPQKRSQELPPVALERTSQTGLKHLDGVISMARGGPDSATSDFFICIGDQPSLDFGGMRNPDGQAAFGRVVQGMDVVRRIQQAPAEGQALKPPVRILTARRAAVGQFEAAVDGAVALRARLFSMPGAVCIRSAAPARISGGRGCVPVCAAARGWGCDGDGGDRIPGQRGRCAQEGALMLRAALDADRRTPA